MGCNVAEEDRALELKRVSVVSRAIRVLNEVSFVIRPGETTAVVGSNASGKTALAEVVAGIRRPSAGHVSLRAGDTVEDIGGLGPRKLVRKGIVLVPANAPVFEGLSVIDNLLFSIATAGLGRRLRRDVLGGVLSEFPILEKRSSQLAGLLSGGEMKTLAIARGILLVRAWERSKENNSAFFPLVVLDEPTRGLHPGARERLKHSLTVLAKGAIALLALDESKAFALELTASAFQMHSGSLLPITPSAPAETSRPRCLETIA